MMIGRWSAITASFLRSLGRKTKFWQFFALLVIFIFALQIENPRWNMIKVSDDDSNYLAHATTIALDFDFDYSNETLEALRGNPNAHPVHGMGPGVLGAPFVGLFYQLDRLQNTAFVADRAQVLGSWAYFGFSFASSFYFLLGIYLYYRAASALGARLGKVTLVLLCTGTGVLFYATIRPHMSHSFEFFCFALIVYASVRLAENKDNRGYIWNTLIAFGVSLSWLTRFYALYAIALPYIVFVIWHIFYSEANNKTMIKRMCVLTVYIFMFMAAGIMLTFIAFKGQLPYYTSLGREGLTTLGQIESRSKLPDNVWTYISYLRIIIFGNSFPLILSSPIIPFGVALLFISLYAKLKRYPVWVGLLMIITLCYLAGPILLVMGWRTHASAYGFRYLYGLVPIGMLGLFLWRRFCWQNLLRQRLVFSLLIIASIFSTTAVVVYPVTQTIDASRISEFGREDRFSAKGQLYRISSTMMRMRWIGEVLRKQSAVKPLAAIVDSSVKIYGAGRGNPNISMQALIITLLWSGCIGAYVFKVKDGSDEVVRSGTLSTGA